MAKITVWFRSWTTPFPPPPRRSAARGKPRQATTERRAEILRAAADTFGSKGYNNGSLAEVAEQVGITHAGVLHHFGSKEQLLVEVLEYRDKEDVRDLEGQHIPGGLGLFQHLVRTARMNVDRPGIVQGYSVLTGESVTENHPARDWVTDRFRVLRGEIVGRGASRSATGTVPRDDRRAAPRARSSASWTACRSSGCSTEDVDLPDATPVRHRGDPRRGAARRRPPAPAGLSDPQPIHRFGPGPHQVAGPALRS